MFSRGIDLAPYGSVEDRVMREMVFRERTEKVAFIDAVGKMVARVFNVDADKAFSGIIAEYASEVFQESYDADLLRRKIAARRVAWARVRAKRRANEDLIKRLDRMGEYYDKMESAKKVSALAQKGATPPSTKPQQKPKQNK
jgi:hypothetical protein